MQSGSIRRVSLLFSSTLAMACGGSSAQSDKPKTPPKPPHQLILSGAIEGTTGVKRVAKSTTLSEDELQAQGYLFIGTVATDAKEDPEAVILQAAGDKGGELVVVEAEKNSPPCAVVEPPADTAVDSAAGGESNEDASGQTAAAAPSEDAQEASKAGQGEAGAQTEGEGKAAGEVEGEVKDATAATEEKAPAEGDPADAGNPNPAACPEALPLVRGRVWARAEGAPAEAVANWQTLDRVRLLHNAVALGPENLAAIQELVSAGADINAPGVDDITALHLAIDSGNPDWVGVVIGLGAKLQPAPVRGLSLLQYAVAAESKRYNAGSADFNVEQHHALLGALVGGGAERAGAQALAVKMRFCATAEHLIGLGLEGSGCGEAAKEEAAELEAQGLNRSLRAALDAGEIDKAKVLLKKGADVNFVDDNPPWEIAAIAKAAADGNAMAFAFLLKKKAKFAIADGDVTQGLLRNAARDGVKDLVTMLIKKKVGTTTALHSAVAGKDPKKIVPVLLKTKPDVNATNDAGQTALYLLLRRGCDKRLEAHGQAPGGGLPAEPAKELVSALKAFDKVAHKVAGLLLKKKANPNLSAGDGSRPLDVATGCGLKKTKTLLKKKGAKAGTPPKPPEPKPAEPAPKSAAEESGAEDSGAQESAPEGGGAGAAETTSEDSGS